MDKAWFQIKSGVARKADVGDKKVARLDASAANIANGSIGKFFVV